MTPDLLPPNATKQERALSLSIARAATPDAGAIRRVWNADECPESLLPWLAWAMGVDHWDSAWTEAQKRESIRAAFEVRRTRGTIGAIKRAVASLGYGDAVIEENVAAPFTFSIRLASTPSGVGEAQLREIEAVALRTKNARSHLVSIISVLAAAPEHVSAGATITGMVVTVYPAAA